MSGNTTGTFASLFKLKSDIDLLRQHWRTDLLSGFLVFLIALPLCLGIAMASGFPPTAGIITAIIGGLLVSRISGSTLTINGPAAGLIIVVLSAVQTLGEGDMLAGYRYTLAAVVIAGVLQVLLGACKLGQLSTVVPTPVVHGMLAAIGTIIVITQLPVLFGAPIGSGSVLSKLIALPHSVTLGDWDIALLSLVGFWLLVLIPVLNTKLPAPLVVVMVGMGFAEHFQLPASQLVTIPDHFSASFYFPDFTKVTHWAFWEAVLSLCLIGSLETLLSAAAIDKLDPEKRRTDLNRDLAAVGSGNVLSGLLGGLPMIAEIVRSSANVNNRAKSSWANFFHGALLLFFVTLFPALIQKIPLAALAVLLVYTGYRLAEPTVWGKVREVGKEQLIIFMTTLLAVLLTDLLIGVLIGILLKLLISLLHGVWLNNLFRIHFSIREQDDNQVIALSGSALFSNFLPLKTALLALPPGENLVFDFSNGYLIDHTVMEFLHDFQNAYTTEGGQCQFLGDAWQTFSDHNLAARLMTADDRKS